MLTTYYSAVRRWRGEIQLLHFVYNQPNIDEIRGNPRKVLDVIDGFAKSQQDLMNVSHAKGKTVIDLTVEAMSRHDARTGCLNFVGYTTILFGDAVSHTR